MKDSMKDLGYFIIMGIVFVGIFTSGYLSGKKAATPSPIDEIKLRIDRLEQIMDTEKTRSKL